MSGSHVGVPGPLGPFVGGFRVELARLGYSSRSFEAQVRLVRHLSGWLEGSGSTVADLTEEVLGQFVVVRRGVTSNMRSRRALSPLMTYLRGLGVAPAATVVRPQGVAAVLAGFGAYLTTERALAAWTVASYVSQAKPFFEAFPVGADGRWMGLTARQVDLFVTRRAVGLRVGRAPQFNEIAYAARPHVVVVDECGDAAQCIAERLKLKQSRVVRGAVYLDGGSRLQWRGKQLR